MLFHVPHFHHHPKPAGLSIPANCVTKQVITKDVVSCRDIGTGTDAECQRAIQFTVHYVCVKVKQ